MATEDGVKYDSPLEQLQDVNNRIIYGIEIDLGGEEEKINYLGMQSDVSKVLPIDSITSPAYIRINIFQEMENLPMI